MGARRSLRKQLLDNAWAIIRECEVIFGMHAAAWGENMTAAG